MAVVLTETLTNIGAAVVNQIPNVIGAIILLVIGLVVGKILGRIVREVLVRGKVDEYITKKEHLKFEISSVFDVIIRWVIYLVFIQAAVSPGVLGIPALADFFGNIVAFLAGILGAAVIMMIAYGVGIYIKEEIIGRETSYADLTGKMILYMLIFLGVALGLEIAFAWMPVKITLVSNILLILVASISIGIAIALGLGLKDIIREMATGYAKEFARKRRR